MKVFNMKFVVEINLEAAGTVAQSLEDVQKIATDLSKNRSLLCQLVMQLPCQCPEHWKVQSVDVCHVKDVPGEIGMGVEVGTQPALPEAQPELAYQAPDSKKVIH